MKQGFFAWALALVFLFTGFSKLFCEHPGPPGYRCDVIRANTGSQAVNITGTGFTYSCRVTFGTTPATLIATTVGTRTRSYFWLPVLTKAHAPGMVHIHVTCRTKTATSSGEIIFANKPTLTNITPPSGPHAGGTTVTITGTNFFPGATMVTFGGVAATTVVVLSTTTLTVKTPRVAITRGITTVGVTNETGTPKTKAPLFTYVT